MSRPASVIILGEDTNKRQQNMVWRYLRKRGYSPKQIYIRPCPVGDTPGIAFVRSKYPIEVHSLHVATASQGLVVAIDADEETVAARKIELDQRLKDAGEAARGDDEPIAIIVPKRKIETWIWYFDGNAVDEATDYKRSSVKDNHDASSANRAFAEFVISGQAPDANCPPSLEDARDELLRIPT